MKKIVLLLIVATTLWGEDLAFVTVSGHTSFGSGNSITKERNKTDAKPYTLDIKENKLQCTFQNDSESTEIHFLTTRGQLLSKHSFEKREVTIDLSTFANALYLVKGYQGGEVIFAKAIQVQ